jgi:signal transduction histidine kinase
MSRLAEVRRAARRHTLVTDGILAVTVYALALVASKMAHGYDEGTLDAQTTVVGALISAALVFRRRWPRGVLGLTTTGTALYLALGGVRGPLLLVTMVAIYTVALDSSRRFTVAVASITAMVLAVSGVAFGERWWLSPVIVSSVAQTGLAAAVGEAVRSKRAYVAAIEERAHRAERTREEEAARRVMEERLRIARELHDVLAHHVALINVQAGVAAHVLETEPDQAREALAHIRQAGRSALEELRTTVGLLRQPSAPADLADLADPGTAPGDVPETAPEPVPGLDRLPQLVASFTATGLRVEQHVEGRPRGLPATVDLAAYRIVQEALTNVRKHAPGATAVVRLGYLPGRFRVEVTDSGTSAPAGAGAGTGHGLLGMRERALSVGGVFSANPEPDSGFRVTAVLPAAASSLTMDRA